MGEISPAVDLTAAREHTERFIRAGLHFGLIGDLAPLEPAIRDMANRTVAAGRRGTGALADLTAAGRALGRAIESCGLETRSGIGRAQFASYFADGLALYFHGLVAGLSCVRQPK